MKLQELAIMYNQESEEYLQDWIFRVFDQQGDTYDWKSKSLLTGGHSFETWDLMPWKRPQGIGEIYC